MEQDINDKIKDLCFEIRENRKAIKNVNTNIELSALGILIVGLLVGDGMDLTKAIWIMFGCGFLWFIYTVYRENKHTKKTLRRSYESLQSYIQRQKR